MRKLLALALLALPLLGAKCPGLVLNADHQGSANAAQSLGAKNCRIEFAASASATSLDADLDYLTARGCRPILLAGFSLMPTTAEATNLANWAVRFGPGGRYPDELAVRSIEFGNETSYRNGAPDGPGAGDDWWASSQYISRAQNYGARAAEAVNAINSATGGDVGLLVQADHGGSGSPNWVNNMFSAAPSLKTSAAGFVVHPYGPSPQTKLGQVVGHLNAAGVATDKPIDVTEYGIATDNGNCLSDNYGWPTCMTYDQAALALELGINNIENAIPDRLRYLFIYSAHDLQPSGTGQREHYFGCLKNTNGEKGNYSARCRAELAE